MIVKIVLKFGVSHTLALALTPWLMARPPSTKYPKVRYSVSRAESRG